MSCSVNFLDGARPISKYVFKNAHLLYVTTRNKHNNKQETNTMADRVAAHKINPLFLERYSTRTFDADKSVTQEELKSIFEAARWAASSVNVQPWRFVVVRKSNPDGWNKVFPHLMELNQKWVQNAELMIVVLSYKKASYYGNTFDSQSHQFDAGLATAQLLLQAHELGVAAHPIGGFNEEKVHEEIVGNRENKNDYKVNAIVVVGKPLDAIPAHELPRSQRNAIEEFVFENDLSEATDSL
jgi:nitroreductase